MSKPESIVNALLEVDHDAHMKAYDRVQKWDKAHSSYKDLWKLKQKAHAKFREIGTAVGYERALARAGLTHADVSRQIYGNQIGATHNYKKTMPVTICRDSYCQLAGKPRPAQTEVCGSCGTAMKQEQMRIPPSVLHGKLARHMVGVVTNDGRNVFFDEPVPPEPEID